MSMVYHQMNNSNILQQNIESIVASQPIKIMTDIRLMLHNTLYMNNEFFVELIKKLNRRIDTLQVSYDISTFSITIKIKKTTMKKVTNFEHNVLFYYGLITDAIREILSENQAFVINCLRTAYGDKAIDIFFIIMQNPGLISLIYNATCISDNIINISL